MNPTLDAPARSRYLGELRLTEAEAAALRDHLRALGIEPGRWIRLPLSTAEPHR